MSREDDELVDTVAKALYRRVGEGSIFSLPWVSRVVLIVLAAQGDTDNGGFISFFERDWPGGPGYSVFAEAFRAIGAEETAQCIEAAAGLFPFGEPHLRGDQRREYLLEHCMVDGRTDDSARLVQLGDRVIDLSDGNYALLARYVRGHLEEIRGGGDVYPWGRKNMRNRKRLRGRCG